MTENTNNRIIYFTVAVLVVVALSEPLLAGSVETLKAPLKAMKEEVWSYMFIVKVGSVVVGSCLSVIQGSVTPLGISAAITAGIHFFDSVIGDGSTALLGF